MGFDYDFWLGPAPDAPDSPARCHMNFRWIYDYSGGQVTEWGRPSSRLRFVARLPLRSDRVRPYSATSSVLVTSNPSSAIIL